MHSKCRPISHRFRDKRQFLSKIANFLHPVHLTPPLKGFPLELGIGARRKGVTKASMMGYQMIVKSFKIGLVV